MKRILAGIVLLAVGTGGLTAQAVDPQSGEGAKTKWRGFNVRDLDESTLRDAKNVWHANLVRWQMPIMALAGRKNITPDEAWREIVRNLPAGLDLARKYGLLVDITIPQTGTFKDDPAVGDHYKNLERFWDDEANLQMLRAHWQEIAKIGRDRDQEIWYDLVNEPVDKRGWPATPKQWPGWAQTLIDDIRAIDPVHAIVIEPGAQDKVAIKTMPRLRGANLIYSVHVYEPHTYTHQGIRNIANTPLAQAATELNKSWPGTYHQDYFGTEYWDAARLGKLLEGWVAFQKANPDIRIFVGEFSAIRWAPNAADYIRDCIEIFEKNGWDWAYHAFREYPGWSLEHTDEYSLDKPQLSSVQTDRGKVVGQFMSRNVAPEGAADGK